MSTLLLKRNWDAKSQLEDSETSAGAGIGHEVGPTPGRAASTIRRSAFSLLEVMVVVGMLSILGLVLAPALARTKPNTKAIQCMNNLRQFMTAWTMYAVEHSDQLVNNLGIGASSQGGIQPTWANGVISWDSSSMNTNIALLKAGPLAQYLGGNVRVYKCPADVYLSQLQRSLRWTARIRSISMNSFFGRESLGNDSTAQGLNWLYPQYAQYLKMSRVAKPAKTWVVLDEHPDSINDGLFINDPTATAWLDVPASYHNGGCGFAFADGHSEIRAWLSSKTILPISFSYNPPTFDSAGRLDFKWYLERTGLVAALTGKPAYGY